MCLAKATKFFAGLRNFSSGLCLSLANTPENNRVSKEKRSHRLSDPSTPQAGNRWVFSSTDRPSRRTSLANSWKKQYLAIACRVIEGKALFPRRGHRENS